MIIYCAVCGIGAVVGGYPKCNCEANMIPELNPECAHAPDEQCEHCTDMEQCWPDEQDVQDTTAMASKAQKIQMDLIPFGALEDAVAAFQVGVGKHGKDSWRQGMPYSVCGSALLRHYSKWQQGEDFDQVDGQAHMSAIAFYALVILQYERDGRKDLDDRYGR